MFTVYFPYHGSAKTAKCLSDEDLGWQVFEAENLLISMDHFTPISTLLAQQMIAGYEMFLLMHLWQLSTEARRRGVHSPADRPGDDPYLRQWKRMHEKGFDFTVRTPRWCGAEWLHESHRSQLIRHNPRHYGHQFPRTPLDMPHLYPRNLPERFDFSIGMPLGQRRLLQAGERVIPPRLILGNKHMTEAFG